MYGVTQTEPIITFNKLKRKDIHMHNIITSTTNPIKSALIPNVIQRTPNGERAYDLFSRLLEDRIVMLNEEVNPASASTVCAQLLYLESVDPNKDISLYINSPGGSVSDGLAVLDTMNFIKCDVSTICMGMAASMGAVLLAAGAKGKRFCLPHSEVMIHQPLGGAQGQATDIEIATKHILRTKKTLYAILSAATGKNFDEVTAACERDNWLTAEEAMNFGLIDKIIANR